MADLLHVRTRKRDPIATKAAAYLHKRSYRSFDGREFLFGADMSKRRAECFERDGRRCTRCHRPAGFGTRLVADHIESKGLGGSDDLSNLRTRCETFVPPLGCHQHRHLEDRGDTA